MLAVRQSRPFPCSPGRSRRLRVVTVTPNVLEPLLVMLQDDESVLRSCAARTIGELSAVLHS